MKVLVGIPTLNEYGNIQKLVASILNNLSFHVDILVVDDGSSDGTAEYLVKEAEFGKIYFVQRLRQLGVGSAHKCIIEFANKHNYSFLATLDADGTHSINDLDRVIRELVNSQEDLIIGSRFIDGGTLRNWPIHRRIATNVAHVLTKMAIAQPFDCTSGLRAYRISPTLLNEVEKTEYEDYRFFYKSVFNFLRVGVRISQIPVTLESRHLGSSKMNPRKTYSLAKSLFIDSCLYSFSSRFLSHK